MQYMKLFFLIQHKILNIYIHYIHTLYVPSIIWQMGLVGEFLKSEDNFEYKTFYIKFKVKTIYF